MPRTVLVPEKPFREEAPTFREPELPMASKAYVVRKGDSLSRIADAHGVSMGELAAVNGIRNPNKIRVGQELTLPGGARQGFAPVRTPARARRTPVKRSTGGTYTVKAGDTLSEIAAAHGTTVAALKSANGLKGNTIRVGQKLAISGAGARKVGASKKAHGGTAKKPVSESSKVRPDEPALPPAAEPPGTPAPLDFGEPPTPAAPGGGTF
jgi:LysM repeat protein